MANRLTYRLKQNESKSDINQDASALISFSGEKRLIPVGEINHVVNLSEEFNKERNSSFIYRIKGTVSPVFSNPLMNPEGTQIVSENNNGLDIFNLDVFKKDPLGSNDFGKEDLTYQESYNKNLKENNGWFGFSEPDIKKGLSNNELNKFYDIEPTRKRFDLNSYVDKNWELTITYPQSSDKTHYIVNDGIQNGLLINNAESVVVGGKPMLAMGTSAQHGLETGDKVRIFGCGSSNNNGDFTVKRVGLDNGDYKANYFVIDIDPTTVQVGNKFGTGRMRKLVSGQESVYYLRKFKKLMINGDYEMYPLAFSKSIFGDQNYQFIINNDIDVEGLTDNLGRPLSELYVTFIKTNSNGMFGPIKAGLDLEDLPGNIGDNSNQIKLSNARQLHDGLNTPFTSHTPLPTENDLYVNYENKDWFYGDLVEYNKFTLKETKLANVLHRFNTVARENATSSGSVANGPRREGYLYNPHYLYKIREFSTYIEQGDSATDGIPDYAENLGDGRFLWRDFLDIGTYNSEGEILDYPFTNGAHYLHENICFMTTRQDPFGKYNLYYEGNSIGQFDPKDPIGDGYTDKFTIKSGENGC